MGCGEETGQLVQDMSVPFCAAGMKDTAELDKHGVGNRRPRQGSNGLVGVVRETTKLDLPIFPDDVTGPWVAVPRLTDTAGIDDDALVKVPEHGEMRVANADEVSVNPLDFFCQRFVGEFWPQVFVEVSRR